MNFLRRPLMDGRVNFPVCLAPMVGLSHLPFRRLLRHYLPEGAVTLWPTEMLSSLRIPNEDLGETPESIKDANEFPLVPQILGNAEEPIRRSLEKLIPWGANAVDINMGCPVRKALRHNYGVALMGDPDYAAQVVKWTRKHCEIPISVKIRAGFTKDPDYLLNFVRGLVDAGASWITFHPRRADQVRRGNADWSQLKFLRENIDCPLIGNGDVQTALDVERMLEETGCDMVMVGRALTARPWLLWQVGEKMGLPPPRGRTGPAPSDPVSEGAELGKALQILLSDMTSLFRSDEVVKKKFEFYVRNASAWLHFGLDLQSRVSRSSKPNQLSCELEEFFSREQPMSSHTNLRY